MRSFLTKLLLVAGSTLLTLAAANVALWALNLGNIEVYDHDPEYGYLTKPDQWPSPRGTVFRINRAGLRGPDFSPAKEPDTLRITFIGDSVTFGGGIVSDGNTFVALSAAQLSEMTGRKVDTVNISAPGWGVQNMQRYIKRRGIYGADVAVWVLPWEDFHRPMSWAQGMPYRKPAVRLTFLASVAIEKARAAWKNMTARSPRSSRNEFAAADPLIQNVKIFKQALGLIRNSGARIVVIFFPDYSKPVGSDPAACRQFRTAAESSGVQTCDISQQIETGGGAALFYDGAHLNGRGHQVTGQLVAECLSRVEPSVFQVAARTK
jgi:hypothetical protein